MKYNLIMKKIKNLLSLFGEKFNTSIKAFPLTLLYLLTISLYSSYLIIIESFNINEQFIIFSLFTGMLCSILISLYKKEGYIFNTITSILLSIISYVYLKDDVYHYLTILALLLLLVTGIVFLLFKNNNEGKLFAHLICWGLYCLALCTIVFAGVSIVLAAIQFLIYEFKDFYKLIFINFFIIYIFVCVSLFISSFIHEDEKTKIPNVYKTIFHKAALTLCYLLLIVLYIYLLKILITLKMPVGQLNWFASFALLFNIFFYISGEFDDDFLIKFHQKYGGIILIPIFIIQTIAIYIRVNAYGLTPLRYLSIAFNIIGLSFIVSSIVKKKLFIYPVFVVLVLLIFISPLNVVDVPAFNQEKILKNVLAKNNMLVNNEIIPKNDISIEDKETINSAYNYLLFSESDKLTLKFKDNFIDTFGFDLNGFYNDCYCYYYSDANFILDVEDYKYMEIIEDYKDRGDKITICDIDISDKLLEIYNTYGSNGILIGENQTYETINNLPCFSFILNIDENTKLIFESLSYSIIDNKVQYVSYHAYKLSK